MTRHPELAPTSAHGIIQRSNRPLLRLNSTVLLEVFFELAPVLARFAPWFRPLQDGASQLRNCLFNALFAQSFAQSRPNMPKHPKESQLGHS
jgi:hypothetical protein